MDNSKQVGEQAVGAFSDFQQSENVSYDRNVKNSHIDMNPSQVVEPLTGSSVLVEPKVEGKVPNNGFPIGYGPNAHLKKIEKPKKPKFRERMKYARKKLTKKQKILMISIPVLTAAVITGVVIYANVTGAFKIDYSGTYAAAKELRTEMQKLRSDASCSKVIEYVSNAYTTKEAYQKYVEGCRRTGQGITSDIVTVLGNTPGILKDEEVRKRYETFSIALEAAKEGNSQVDELLDRYVLWHQWILAESNGDSSYSDFDWPEASMDTAANILIKSNLEDLKKYGEEWLKYKKEAVTAYHNYFHHGTINAAIPIEQLYAEMTTKTGAFNDWKKKNEPSILELYPLELVDTAKLYARFEEFYDYIREVYQNNYNREIGGCKELVNSVVCD